MENKRIPTMDEMGGRKAWAWAGWRLYRDTCRRRFNPNYDFEKLSDEAKFEDYLKFEESYEDYEKESKNSK